jgi:2-iminobutanoate/2-iminopropanoate deaminase
MKRKASNVLVAVVMAASVAGCSGMGGRMWVPQGPGDIPEPKAEKPAPQPTRSAQPAAQPARPAVAQAPAPGQLAAALPPAGAVPGGYTQATRYGDLLFVSGQIGLDPVSNQLKGNAEEQTRQAMENVRAVLESNRLNMANVVAVTVYLKDLTDFRAVDGVYETFFRGALPARTIVEVARLPRSALVEISVIAGR